VERDSTSLERRLLAWARGRLDSLPTSGWRSWAVELGVFGVKQGWACVFGALMLLVLVVTALVYPADAGLHRNDALVLLAVAIQVGMVLGRLETGRELWVVVLFLGAVPLYSGFMYAAVGSYMVRVMRLFDLRFTRYPPIWATALVAFFIWIAENVGTAAGAWFYPSQLDGWELVPLTKFVSWFLLMIVSVVLVTFVYRPRAPEARHRDRAPEARHRDSAPEVTTAPA
jgi:uncharacterized membrane protein YoaT (DUF817 family)